MECSSSIEYVLPSFYFVQPFLTAIQQPVILFSVERHDRTWLILRYPDL